MGQKYGESHHPCILRSKIRGETVLRSPASPLFFDLLSQYTTILFHFRPIFFDLTRHIFDLPPFFWPIRSPVQIHFVLLTGHFRVERRLRSGIAGRASRWRANPDGEPEAVHNGSRKVDVGRKTLKREFTRGRGRSGSSMGGLGLATQRYAPSRFDRKRRDISHWSALWVASGPTVYSAYLAKRRAGRRLLRYDH